MRNSCRWLLLLGLVAASAGAQSGPTQQSITAELQQPFLMLRGMYDGDKLAFDAQGQLIGSATPMPFSLSFLVVQSVTVAPDQVEIDASRAGLEITRGWPVGFPDKVKAVPIDKKGRFQVVITISRDRQHDELLEAALNRVFHVGFDDSLTEVAPQYWRPWIGHELHPERPYPVMPVGVETGPGVPANRKPKPDKIQYPRLVHTVDPPTTEAARIRSLQGQSAIGLIVDAAGIPRDLVIVQPLGMGLDEMAVLAVMQFRFAPALKKGKPVPVWINVLETFRD